MAEGRPGGGGGGVGGGCCAAKLGSCTREVCERWFAGLRPAGGYAELRQIVMVVPRFLGS